MSDFDPLDLQGLQPGARVVVAMSGGVDSSVAAAMLNQAGFEVIGITLQLYDHGEAVGRSGSCCAGRDIADARRVAEALGIPHYVLDYEKRFQDRVIDEFANSYLAGETPVPCVACNQNIKFLDLLDTANELGGQALVTGHYVRSRCVSNSWQLHQAVDAERDQSYFLFATQQEQLKQLRFPLGGLAKSKTRALAKAYNLPVAEKSDSQDICFVPTGRYSSVIEKLRPDAVEPGDIVHVDGRILGNHPGIVHYTVGQRRGLGVAQGEPMYVVRLDVERRQVIVGPRECLTIDQIYLRDMNWLGDGRLDDIAEDGIDVHVKIRSTQQPQAAKLSIDDGKPVVNLARPEYGVSPGQACVFYDGARVLGGGWIASTNTIDNSAASFGCRQKNGSAQSAHVIAT
jgi:tRNA-specific 2-thiouridylase